MARHLWEEGYSAGKSCRDGNLKIPVHELKSKVLSQSCNFIRHSMIGLCYQYFDWYTSSMAKLPGES